MFRSRTKFLTEIQSNVNTHIPYRRTTSGNFWQPRILFTLADSKLCDLCGWIFKNIATDGSNKSSKQKMVDMDIYI